MFGIYAAFGLLHFGVNHFGSYGLFPYTGRTAPMLHRVPRADDTNRLAGFTEIVSSIFNSLLAKGQIVMQSQTEWSLNVVYQSTTSPTSADDQTLGHFAGQLWLNIVEGRAFLCFSALTGSVSWKEFQFI